MAGAEDGAAVGTGAGVVAELFGVEAGMGDGTGACPVEAGMEVDMVPGGMVLHPVEMGAVERLLEAHVATGTVKQLSEPVFLT